MIEKSLSGNLPNVLPLAVDIDGTLVKTDTLWESIIILVKKNPLFILLMPLWLMRGRAHLKHETARRVEIDVSSLPYNMDFLAYLRNEHRRGRPLVLTTASDLTIAEKISNHLGIFSDVLASNGRHNMKGSNKLIALKERFGYKKFDYAGNDYADLKVWVGANKGIVVNGSEKLLRKAQRVTLISHVFDKPKNRFVFIFHAIRIHQWVKNILIFIPLILAHRLMDYSVWRDAVYAFFAFSILASSVYILNDLLDLENDRHHYKKRQRPFASGELPISYGIISMPLLLLGSASISLLLPVGFSFILIMYYVITLAYSFYLKRVVLVDVIVLAVLYTLRVIAGGTACNVNISRWMLAFSVFIFTSLAFAKRCSELHTLRKNNKDVTKGRGYLASDLEQLASLGTSSGYIAVLVLALYINSAEVKALYKRPDAIWLVCPLFLYWISRIWLLAHRGQMHEDPIVFAIKDLTTYIIGIGVILILLIAVI